MEKDKILIQLENIYKEHLVEEVSLAKIISDLKKEQQYYEDPRAYSTPGIMGMSKAEVAENGSYIKITVEKIPEQVDLFRNIGTQYHKQVKEFWTETIRNSLNYYNIKTKYDKCVIVINIIYKDIVWDVDNHTVSFIINAIKKHLIVPDDNWKHVEYMVTGQESEEEAYKTEIYIIDKNSFPHLYVSLL